MAGFEAISCDISVWAQSTATCFLQDGINASFTRCPKFILFHKLDRFKLDVGSIAGAAVHSQP